MTFATSFLLAAAAVSQAPLERGEERGRGAQVETAKITVQILRPAVLRHGTIASAENGQAPRSQVLKREGRVTYEFE